MKKCCCALPTLIGKTLCETVCIYRTQSYRHLACRQALKTDACVAPCLDPCPCHPNLKNGRANQQAGRRNEVSVVQEKAGSGGVHVRLRAHALC